MRILFDLQVAIWVWLCFEDIDAPATAAMHIFLAFALFDSALGAAPFASPAYHGTREKSWQSPRLTS